MTIKTKISTNITTMTTNITMTKNKIGQQMQFILPSIQSSMQQSIQPYIQSSEFIVESINESDNTWKFFGNQNKYQNTHVLNDSIPKKFTSLATNATIFRWKFGDEPGDPIVETTLNPYIHTYSHSGTYSVSHQSCYPCLSTGTLICSNGWCTKSIEVEKLEAPEPTSLVALAGLTGLFIIIKGEDCCDIRKKCAEQRAACSKVSPNDIKSVKECQIIEKSCAQKLKDCEIKCIKTGNIWEGSSYRCRNKKKPYKEMCQTIERQEKYIGTKKI